MDSEFDGWRQIFLGPSDHKVDIVLDNEVTQPASRTIQCKTMEVALVVELFMDMALKRAGMSVRFGGTAMSPAIIVTQSC